jgi:mono/diheme cytochrome c family protein
MKMNFKKGFVMSMLLTIVSLPVWAQEAANNVTAESGSLGTTQDYLPWILVSTAVALAIVILFMGALLSKVAILKAKNTLKAILILSGFSSVHGLQAATETSGSVFFTTDILNYVLLGLIFLEVLVILYFANWLKAVILPPKEKRLKAEPFWAKWWDKANAIVPIEQEKDIQLDHDYDGIRELDNSLPPWWVYGFYLTILFAGIYVWRYHIAGTAPLQVEELQISLAEAALKQAEFEKNNANKVDENTIEYKEDAAIIASGKSLFLINCVACHGPEAGGGTGPNLVDNHWKHGGSIKNVFKTIKYGVPDMGMIAWGDVLTPVEIAALSTYIKSIKGTKPANAKEPEGTLEEEDAVGAQESGSQPPVASNL